VSTALADDTVSLLRVADLHFAKAEYREAEGGYRQVLATEPQLYNALIGVARCRTALGHPQEALPFLNQALAGKPGDRDARRELGHAFTTGNLFPRAEQILNELIGTDSNDRESLYYLAVLMYQNGYYGAALSYLDRSNDPKVADPLRQLKTRVYRAVCLSRVGRNQEAEAAFQKLALEPDARKEPDLLLVYAELLYETGRPEQGLKQVDEALRVNPSLAMGYFWRARLLLHLKRLPEAAAAAERSIELIPQLPFPRSLLVRIYQALGRPADAARQADWLRQYEERLAQGPSAR
jgi:tetratricopeptide (TPR) repeat protein